MDKISMGMEGPDYEGLRFSHHVIGDEGDDDAPYGYEKITAHHPEHGEVGHVTYLDYQHPEWSGMPPRAIHVEMLRVKPNHRRRGVATQIMNHLEDRYRDVPIDHGTRTRMGEAWGRTMYGRDSKPKSGQEFRMYKPETNTYEPTHYDADWTLNGKPWNVRTKKFLRGQKKASMPTRGLTRGDPSKPIYRTLALEGPNPLGRSLGTHWTHDLEQAKSYAYDNEEHAPAKYTHHVILEADHPGHQHVMDWSKPEDRKILHDTVMGNPSDADPEIPIRPGAPIHVRAIHHLNPEGSDEDFTRRPVDQHHVAIRKQAELNQPHFRDELIAHAEGQQNLYKPAGEHMYGPGLCGAHALQLQKERSTKFSDLGIHGMDGPEKPEPRWLAVGKGSCGDCSRHQNEYLNRLPGRPNAPLDGPRSSPESRPQLGTTYRPNPAGRSPQERGHRLVDFDPKMFHGLTQRESSNGEVEAQQGYGPARREGNRASNQVLPQGVEEGSEGGESSQASAREVSYHPAVKRDLKKLDPQIARAAVNTIQDLTEGKKHGTSHPLNGPLMGWHATAVRGFHSHRITYRSVPNGPIEIGHVGPHNYDEAVRRLGVMYHWAPKDARDDIAEHGLDHTRAPGFDPSTHGPHGTFMHHTRELADGWVPDIARTHDLYEINTDGLRLHPDPYDTDDASYNEHAVPPARLRRVEASDEYHMNHRPGGPSGADDGTAAQAHEVDKVFPDYYEKPHLYDFSEHMEGGARMGRELHQTLKRIRGNPEADVTMYRALPHEHAASGFRTGDWVSLHHGYARQHGLHETDPSKDWPVIKATVPAKHLWNNGDSIDEFGYHGPPIGGEISKQSSTYTVHLEASTRRDEGPIWYHSSSSPEWSPAGHALHVGEGHAAVDRRDGYLHAFRYRGTAYNDPRDPAIDYVANHAYHEAMGRERSRSDPMDPDHWGSLEWEHQHKGFEEPSSYVERHVQAAREGKGIYYNNFHEGTRPTVSLVAPDKDFEHLGVEPLTSDVKQRFASRFTPTKRVFTHTNGLDHRLWDGDHLKPEIRKYIMSSVREMWSGLHDWSKWAIVYFAGSEASEWTSDDLEGNNDFDVLIGVDYKGFRKANPTFAHQSNQAITDFLNQGFKTYNGPVLLGGVVWDRTTYVNPNSYDIRKIKPYAAYDVSNDRWVVKPPHLPHWSLSKLPKAVQRVLRAASDYAHEVLSLPEPERTQQGAALFDAWHSDRSRAFGPDGEGWWDIANLREKRLDQEGIWAKIVDCKHRANEGLAAAPADWSNTPKFGAVHPYTQQDWYHAGDLEGGRSLYGPKRERPESVLHVGTKQAALDRIDPDKWDHEEFPHIRHARLHRLRLAPGARVCPQIHKDEDDAGSLSFRLHDQDKYDVHAYHNTYEDNGSVSLVGKSHVFRVEEDLGRHPKWGKKEGSVKMMKPSDIHARPGRTDLDEPHMKKKMDDLFMSILNNGYIHQSGDEITIGHGPEGDVVTNGNKRLKAMERAGFDWPIPVRTAATMPEKVRSVLTDDLLKPQYRDKVDRKPTSGHCYAASEAIYHMMGGRESGWTPMQVRHEGESHWFLKHQDGTIIDPTADQFDTPIPYGKAVGRGFLTKQPSSRAQTIIDRVQKSGTLVVEHRHWGGGLNSLFPSDEDGPRSVAVVPWQQAGQRKDRKTYDEDLVARSITHPHEFPIEDVDPRELRATQPKVLRAGVKHYMENNEGTYGEQNGGDRKLGNDVPRIYHREDGQKIILTGHHRAAAALLKGEPLRAMVIRGGWGAERHAA